MKNEERRAKDEERRPVGVALFALRPSLFGFDGFGSRVTVRPVEP
jgi:hypothetical protein